MSDELTIRVNGSEYSLSDEFKESIEDRARREFDENWLFDCWWDSNERGDPILHIETEGYCVPWSRLEQLEFEYAPPEQEGNDSESDNDEPHGEELDNGNGVKSVPKDDVNMQSSGDDEQSEEKPDNKFMVTPSTKEYIPQPESDDPEKIPADPEELPDNPNLVVWVPEDETTECWSTGKALAPQSMFLEWNVQLKADEAPEGSTKLVPGEGGHVEEQARTSNHDRWEDMLKMYDCEVVAEKSQKQSPPDESEYSGKEAEENMDGIANGNNWSFGNR